MSCQTLDKTVLDYSAIGGLQNDTHLVGNQFSLAGSMVPIAQLAWQPLSMILIIKVPPRLLLPVMMFGLGVAQVCAPAAHSFGALAADRFMLGLFDAGALPLLSIITGSWYRRWEQPLRIAAWYGATGVATMLGAILSYGFSRSSSTLSSCTSRHPVRPFPRQSLHDRCADEEATRENVGWTPVS